MCGDGKPEIHDLGRQIGQPQQINDDTLLVVIVGKAKYVFMLHLSSPSILTNEHLDEAGEPVVDD